MVKRNCECECVGKNIMDALVVLISLMEIDRVLPRQHQPRTRKPRKPGPSMATEIVDATETLLAEKQRPMRSGEISVELQNRGIYVGGKYPGTTVASVLCLNKSTFVHVAGRGYWLRKVPLDRSPRFLGANG